MKLMLRLAAALQAVAAYLSSALTSLLALIKKVPAIVRGNEPIKTEEQQKTEE